MQALISKSDVIGKAAAPPSKSNTICALMCAALADGESLIRNPLKSDDIAATTNVLTRVGVRIIEEGGDLRVMSGVLKPSSEGLYCRDSVATFEFMIAVAASIPGTTRLALNPSLVRRPIQPLLEALTALGAECQLEGNVVVIKGGTLAGGTVRFGSDAMQYASALLIVAARAEEGVTIELPVLEGSRSYLLMTIDCLRHFGIRVVPSSDFARLRITPQKSMPITYQVEGDWLQASYLLALGALAGEVLVTNLGAESLQNERFILSILQKMGARFSQRGGSVMVSRSPLSAIHTDLSNAVDLLPIMTVLAVLSTGESKIHGIAGARLGELNCVLALREELGKLGIMIVEEEDSIIVVGTQPIGAVVDTRTDHRLAMAFAVLGAAVGGVTILGAESVSKAYPDFWRVFRGLGGKVESPGLARQS